MGDEFRGLGTRLLWSGKVIDVTRRHLVAPDGRPVVREVVGHPGSVAVLPFDGSAVTLLRQYRAPVGRSILEVPAGKLDVGGEAPEEAAIRELAEETGLAARKLSALATFYNSPGYTDEHTWLYLAEELSDVAAAPQGAEEEAAEIVRISLSEAAHLAASGGIVDAKTLLSIALLLAR